MRKKTAHIISHTHWDREWYLNSKFVNRWLPTFFESLFAMMEKEKEYRFVLDGQTSILDDCYQELERTGRDVEAFKGKVENYAKEGRLILGPYYLQPDWQLISGEALVRNMLYGKEMSEEFGGGTSTGWLLDNFGQIAQAPQIHKQFGMKGIVVWRGVEFEPENLNSEFNWRSPDGTVLPSVYLLSSYRNAMRLADYPDSIYGRIRNEAEKIEPFATTGNVLLMNGYDQETVPDDILPYIRDGKADFGEYEVVQSTPDEYMRAVRAGLSNPQTFSGALYSGRYISVFPGILSSRMYLKVRNDHAQRNMEAYTEPLCAMSAMLGQEYPKKQLDAAWKLLLKNHPHDSICGVSVDDVHTDMEDRFDEVEDRTDACRNRAAGYLLRAVDTSGFVGAGEVYQIFNTVPRERICQVLLPCEYGAAVVKDEMGERLESQRTPDGLLTAIKLPAFGYATAGVYEEEAAAAGKTVMDQTPVMENEYLKVWIQENGSMDVLDKKTGRSYRTIGYLEDCADSGDEYNFSYVKGDAAYTTLQEKPSVAVLEKGILRTVVRIQYLWELPAGLNPDRSARSGETCILPITTVVTLEAGSSVLSFQTVLRNRCRDHRIRVMFPTDLKTGESLAQTQFDVTAHPIQPKQFDNSTIPEDVRRIIIGARESEPITQFPQLDFVAVTDGTAGAAVLNRGLPEYEAVPEHTAIALTLFRCVGWLARVDLNTRIGDAGPEIFTPDAQCLRDMEFRYAFCPFEGTMESGRVTEKAVDFNQPALAVKTAVQQGILPARTSFLTVASEGDIKTASIKQAQDGNGMIVRLWHSEKDARKVTLSFAYPIAAAYETNLAEEKLVDDKLETKPVLENQISVVAEPGRIVTLRVILEGLDVDLSQGQKDTARQPYTGLRCDDQKHIWPEAFRRYEIPAVVTEEECQMEERRAETVEAEYERQLREYEAYERAQQSEPDCVHGNKEIALLYMKTAALHRAALEARLSCVFTRKKRQEYLYGRTSGEFLQYSRLVEPQIGELADQLNFARIDKRVSEYRSDFYIQQEKEQEIIKKQ